MSQRYRVQERLGAGGMGTVWRVQHVESLQYFALKTLHASFATDSVALSRFLHEARTAAALRSKHVVRIIDAQIAHEHAGVNVPYIVMELLEGETLQQVVRRRGTFQAGELLWVFAQLASALQAAHEAGIVHRDIKPENVFLTIDEDGNPIVKLCDFGVAKLQGESGWRSTRTTATGEVVGTPLYMAPEQLRGAQHTTPQTDQWALGMLAYYCLTGQVFFASCDSAADLVVAILAGRLDKPSLRLASLPRALDRWFLKSCNKEPSARFSSALEQSRQLALALGDPPRAALSPRLCVEDGQGPASPPSRILTEEPRRLRAPPSARVVLVAAVLSAGSMLLLFVAMRSQIQSVLGGERLVAAPGSNLPLTATSADGAHSSQPMQKLDHAERDTNAAPPDGASLATLERKAPPHRAAAVAERRPVQQVLDPSAVPPKPPDTELAFGAPCQRSFQCRSGLCVAEHCQ